MQQAYEPEERLFLDSSKTSWKAVLTHIGNKKPSIPIDHAINTKETFETMSTLIELIKCKDHNSIVSGDLKEWAYKAAIQNIGDCGIRE